MSVQLAPRVAGLPFGARADLPPAASPLRAPVPESIETPDEYFRQVYSRHRGIVDQTLQQRLWSANVLVAGAGSVGSFHAFALARLGVRGLVLADPECYEITNLARQAGATLDTLQVPKAQAVADRVRHINPHARLRVHDQGVSADNVDDLLCGVDLVVDSVEFFELEARRALFRAAERRGIPLITAAPVGFGTNILVFRPGGMPFEEYFDFASCSSYRERIAAFAVGLSPRLNGFRDLDMTTVSASGATNAPSLALAASLASAIVATTVLLLLEDPQQVPAAPRFRSFNAKTMQTASGVLRRGNRGWLQRLRRRAILQRMAR